jgi:F-type H+-transporting ATPase subunit gamma
MASLRQIRRRMKSIENIHEITKAMEMIAAFRFKKAENRFAKSKTYLTEMEKLVANLSAAATNLSHPLFEKRAVNKKALVLMTGDKGLCGAYNANLIRAAQNWLKQNAAHETVLIPVGKVGCEFFRKRHTAFLSAYPERGMVDMGFARQLTEQLSEYFLLSKVDSIEVLYNSYRPGGVGQNRIEPLFGLSYLTDAGQNDKSQVEYIYEPGFEQVFMTLLKRYLEGKVYITLLESLVSEYSARMVAMKQATENGEEVLESLKLLRNKTRQATITRELSEIVSGASVLV